MNISIFGLGYVGCVALGCLAQAGHRVIGVDPQPSKVNYINLGKPTIIEVGIDTLIAEQHAAGKIKATTSDMEAIRLTEVSFLCVGTPSTANGHLDLSAIYAVAEQIGQGLKEKNDKYLVAIRSTVPPGTNEEISRIISRVSGKESGMDFAVVSNPEFLREGTAIEDFRNPPFTLVGSQVDWASEMMQEVYADIKSPFLVSDPPIAEMMKYVCNSWHALKITFANEVGTICKQLRVDSRRLMDIFCHDTKLNISKAYLMPGFAYGGSCLPKDLKALRTIAHDYYLSCPVLENVERSNELHKEMVCKEIQRLGRQKIGFLGLAFKSGTDDLRESPIVDVIERLLGKGFNIKIYDPHVEVSRLTGANKEFILQKIPYISRFITADLGAVLDHAELIVAVNSQVGLSDILSRIDPSKIVYDLIGVHKEQQATTTNYQGIAW